MNCRDKVECFQQKGMVFFLLMALNYPQMITDDDASTKQSVVFCLHHFNFGSLPNYGFVL